MMRVCTFEADGRVRIGVEVDGAIADLNAGARQAGGAADRWPGMVEFLDAGEAGRAAAQAAVARAGAMRRGVRAGERVLFAPEQVRFLAPVPRPPKYLCIAGNYMEHLREGRRAENVARPQDIHVFTKPGSTGPVGHETPVVVSAAVTKLDYELEVGIVIGRPGRYIPLEKAAEHIGGYTIVNDLSDREYMPTPDRWIHWFAMKAQDQFGPMGPYLLLAEPALDPPDLGMRLWVNGELRQQARTSDMIFGPAQIVSRLSEMITLEAGDVIATGTPAGNGWSRQAFLKHGDVVELDIEHIGRLRNTIVFEPPVYRNGHGA